MTVEAERAPLDTDGGTSKASRQWYSWRGSPRLLAHVARKAETVVAAAGGSSPSCSIVIHVGDDEEAFDSPAAFLADVSEDALRRFKTVVVSVRSEALKVTLSLHWRRPWWKQPEGWWKPKALMSDPTPALMDAEVTLEVVGAEGATVEDACTEMSGAIARGIRDAMAESASLSIAVGAGAATVALLAVIVAYLLSASSGTQVMSGIVGLVVGVVVCAVGGSWLFPSLEIAAPPERNWRRGLKVIGPIVLTIIVSGITKKLFG